MVEALLSHLDLLHPATLWRVPEAHRHRNTSISFTGRRAREAGALPVMRRTECHVHPSGKATTSTAGAGFKEKGKKTLAHPEYHLIQTLWHPDLNQGKQPADFTRGSDKKVWLRCQGCRHGCGRHHQWEATPRNLTRHGDNIICPFCSSHRAFCECQSVVANPKLSREWHPDNPPANKVAKSSRQKHWWVCPKGHEPYSASCVSRYRLNSGCPVCGRENRIRHPSLFAGRPNLAAEWDTGRNDRSPNIVTLGSVYRAWWICSRNSDHPAWQAYVYNRSLKGNGCPACDDKLKPRQLATPEE